MLYLGSTVDCVGKVMFVKRIDGRDYTFRMHWDAATPGSHYWMIVETTANPEADLLPSEPMPEDVINNIHVVLEKYAGFPNVPAPVYEDERKIVRFRIRLTRTPNGAHPRGASDWMKGLERAIQVEL